MADDVYHVIQLIELLDQMLDDSLNTTLLNLVPSDKFDIAVYLVNHTFNGNPRILTIRSSIRPQKHILDRMFMNINMYDIPWRDHPSVMNKIYQRLSISVRKIFEQYTAGDPQPQTSYSTIYAQILYSAYKQKLPKLTYILDNFEVEHYNFQPVIDALTLKQYASLNPQLVKKLYSSFLQILQIQNYQEINYAIERATFLSESILTNLLELNLATDLTLTLIWTLRLNEVTMMIAVIENAIKNQIYLDLDYVFRQYLLIRYELKLKSIPRELLENFFLYRPLISFNTLKVAYLYRFNIIDYNVNDIDFPLIQAIENDPRILSNLDRRLNWILTNYGEPNYKDFTGTLRQNIIQELIRTQRIRNYDQIMEIAFKQNDIFTINELEQNRPGFFNRIGQWFE